MPCQRHPCADTCKLPEPGQTDILVAAGDCQPYSAWRNKAKIGVREHKGWATTFGITGSVISLNAAVLPRYFFSEQVGGFALPISKTDAEVPINMFRDRLFQIQRANGETHFSGWAYVEVNINAWVAGSRNRTNDERIADQVFGL